MRKETCVKKQKWVSWEKNPKKAERREMREDIRRAQPREVGGVLRRIMGAIEAEPRMKRKKFRHERIRFGMEEELLSLADEPIFRERKS